MTDYPGSSGGRSMYLVAWIFFFGLMMLFFYYYGKAEDGQYQIQRGSLTIKADRHGHYRVPGNINGVPVKFMLDTGATLVAVPQALADQLGLQSLYPTTLQTASGNITGYLTRLNSLRFANFNLTNVKAVIIPTPDNTVLLGMNVLSQFLISQEDGKLLIKK
ncbi:TIGR02281 family clan AA aspartic protease [Legionella dresdenensis]|uniref:TIGR02281 family clan AA aspartic protease n=1 Tax=Legionella dresdenensis TaxID=450200 RepID=A0ABV8CD27_9GAMM